MAATAGLAIKMRRISLRNQSVINLSKNFGGGVLTTSSARAYKPLTDEDGGAAGADDLLRSGVSLETAGFAGVICWKAVVLSGVF